MFDTNVTLLRESLTVICCQEALTLSTGYLTEYKASGHFQKPFFPSEGDGELA